MPENLDRRRSRRGLVAWLIFLCACASFCVLHIWIHREHIEALKQVSDYHARQTYFTSYNTLFHVRTVGPRPPATGPSADALLALEEVRVGTLSLGIGAWCLGLLTIYFARPWRRQIGQICLAATLITVMAWVIDPRRQWISSWGSLLDNAGALLRIGIALASMLVVSTLLIVWPGSPQHAHSIAHCLGCGYDLTGNVSGTCPECGRITLRGRVERWKGEAESIEHVEEDTQADDEDEPAEKLEEPYDVSRDLAGANEPDTFGVLPSGGLFEVPDGVNAELLSETGRSLNSV